MWTSTKLGKAACSPECKSVSIYLFYFQNASVLPWGKRVDFSITYESMNETGPISWAAQFQDYYL